MDWQAKREQLQGQAANEAVWQEHMNLAIAYFEEDLCSADVEHAAQIAGCSSYHFQRIFSFMAGVSLAQYLRRRRLTLAAFALQAGRPVLEVALDYGYESPESFARAFKSLHGIAPSDAKKPGALLKAWPQIPLQIVRQGEMDLDYRVEQQKAFALIGMHTWISTENRWQATAISSFWQQCRKDGTMSRIRKTADIPESTPLLAATYHCTNDGYDYLIGTHWKGADTPEGLTVLKVPAATWAVFPTAELSQEDTQREIALLWHRIFTEWFPTSGYELAPDPELEMHFRVDDDLFRNEIWIPVQKI